MESKKITKRQLKKSRGKKKSRQSFENFVNSLSNLEIAQKKLTHLSFEEVFLLLSVICCYYHNLIFV